MGPGEKNKQWVNWRATHGDGVRRSIGVANMRSVQGGMSVFSAAVSSPSGTAQWIPSMLARSVLLTTVNFLSWAKRGRCEARGAGRKLQRTRRAGITPDPVCPSHGNAAFKHTPLLPTAPLLTLLRSESTFPPWSLSPLSLHCPSSCHCALLHPLCWC
jgi:hypothetical protein